MGCATSIVKYLVFLFNIICLIFGIVLLAVGIVFALSIDEFTSSLKELDISFSLVTTLIIIVGAAVFIISFLGCCGAIRESSCLLTTYAVILFVLFILQVGLAVYAFLQFKDSDTDLKTEIHDKLLDKLGIYYTDKGAQEMIDAIQTEFECCGMDGPGDWLITGNAKLPNTCCKDKPDQCGMLGPNLYTTGCFTPFYDFLQKTVDITGILVIVLAAIEVAGAIIALCLSSSLRNNERRGYYA